MKKAWLILIIVIVLIILGVMIFRPGGEDSWIKDERGVWIKHGYPANTPDHVIEQQAVISGALELYGQEKLEGMGFSSQCLGVVGEYAVDVVHVPRSDEDNLVENQCEAYRSGEVSHFIELDKDGVVVRVV